MAEIRHLIRIKSAPEKIYRAIVTQDGLSNWWTYDTKEIEAADKVGSIIEFGFNNRDTVFKMRVEQLELNKRIVWTCLNGHPEWENTSIFFNLDKDGDQTVLNFGHVNWKSAGGILPLCSFSWAKYLMSLQSYLEKGEGQPHILVDP